MSKGEPNQCTAFFRLSIFSMQLLAVGYDISCEFNVAHKNILWQIYSDGDIQCESQKRKPRFNFKSLKNKKTDHKTNNRE